MYDVKFEWKDYKTLDLHNCLIYCDPPYANTTKYTGTPDFDTDKFWDVMRKWSKDNDIYISEYEAPDDFISVLDIATKTNIRKKIRYVIEMKNYLHIKSESCNEKPILFGGE